MKILAIETSCDETAIALLEIKGNPLIKIRFASAKKGGWRIKILKNLVASQIKIHQPFGGVVPNLAKREHLKNLPILYKKLMASGYVLNPDLIAVTVGPGLEPALWTGINFAKELYRIMNNESHHINSYVRDELRIKNKIKTKKPIIHNSKFIIPVIGVNHLKGHLYSFLLSQKRVNSKSKILNSKQKNLGFKNLNFKFPAIVLLVSGGHTILIKMDSFEKYKKIGETRDDAVGEAFDKVARLLNLSYPGGPEIEKMAKLGNPDAIDFPRPMLSQKNYDFSFSGLKTSILYYLRDNKNFKKEDVAASFQKAAFDVLIKKTLRAANEFKTKSIFISGGVAANKTLAKEFKKDIKKHLPNSLFIIPNSLFCTDNAAMIAVAGYIDYLKNLLAGKTGKKRRLTANGNLSI